MKRKSNLSTLLTGIAAGAGLVMLRNEYVRRHPEAALAQVLVSRSLDREFQRARETGPIQLAPEHRYVIFSDHHKGAGDDADDFRQCKPAYLAALDHYFEHGYTLIVLGDSEELWEQDIPEVLQTYPDVLESEARFHPGRYIRVIGNHDNLWEDPLLVQRYLEPLFPGLQCQHSVLFDFQGSGQGSGQVFLVHGHQGTLDSEVFSFLPPLVLPIYRQIQNLTGIGHTSPSRDACLRAEHDTMMYRWASQKGKLLLICGHTHRPVWSSLTHLEKLSRRLHMLLGLPAKGRPADYEEQVFKLTGEIKEREEKHRPCKDTIKTDPCYFNTGCCRFDDGDITGIELENGTLRLIKWGGQEGSIQRIELEASHLSAFFALL